jgi:hypothetical protein
LCSQVDPDVTLQTLPTLYTENVLEALCDIRIVVTGRYLLKLKNLFSINKRTTGLLQDEELGPVQFTVQEDSVRI